MVVVIIIMWKTIDLDIIFEKIIWWKKWYICSIVLLFSSV